MKKIIYNPQRDNINEIINSEPNLVFIGARKYSEDKAVALFDTPKVRLPDFCFEERAIEAQLVDEGTDRYAFDKLTCHPDKDGIEYYLKGAEYPMRFFVDKETMTVLNIVKRLLMDMLRITPYLSLRILLNPISFLTKMVTSYNDLSMKILGIYDDRPQVLLKQEYMSPMAVELKWLIFNFLKEFINQEESMRFAKIVANIINCDNAYYIRFADLFNETSAENLSDPRKEIKRLLKINNEREVEHPQVRLKFKLASSFVSLVFLHPKIRKSFIKAVDKIDFDKIKPDTIDRYWMCQRTDYDCFGLSAEERKKSISHLKLPIKV
jgi:hypothetical protein